MRIVLGWVGAFVVLVAAIAGGVAAANATVFSASAFAETYLRALSAGQVAEALTLPGVDAAGLDERLLTGAAVVPFRFEVVGDQEADGVHRVTVEFTAEHGHGTATLEVERIGSRFGLFPDWGFARSPITPVSVTITGDARLQLNGVDVDAPDGGPTSFALLTPGVYTVGAPSELLDLTAVSIVAEGEPLEVALEATPSSVFVEEVQAALEADLTACAEQAVLFPTGCPFGYAIQNRVIGDPAWTITAMPEATLASAEEFGVWSVPSAAGTAHLTAQVQSLFDGSVSTFETDVDFEARYLIAFDADGDVVLQAPGG